MSKLSTKILQGFSVFLSVIGGVMSLGSNFVTLIPKWWLTDEQTQYWGLIFFVVSVVLFMAGTFIDGLLKEASEPKLNYGDVKTEYKPIYPMLVLQNGQKIVGKDKLAEFDFAYLEINNIPKNRASGQTAESTRAQIIFKTKKGDKVIDYGRWCDKDMPLLTPGDDIKSLKKVDIDPGNPELLVLAYKKKGNKNIHSFYFTDHKRLFSVDEIEKLCKERIIGKAPVEAQVILEGKFEPVKINLVIDVDKKGLFIVREKTFLEKIKKS